MQLFCFDFCILIFVFCFWVSTLVIQLLCFVFKLLAQVDLALLRFITLLRYIKPPSGTSMDLWLDLGYDPFYPFFILKQMRKLGRKNTFGCDL